MNHSTNECDARAGAEGGQASGRHALLLALLAPLIMLLIAFIALRVYASTPLSIAGYADFAYGNDLTDEPTANMSESKVWWNDGYWWAILYNLDEETYRIYQLDAESQEWMDTGVAVDEREDTRADVLWDEATQKLYVASHTKRENPSPPHGSSIYWARLYRFSYDEGTNTYSLDSDFPVTELNRYRTESLVLDKDSTGRLWTTWVGRTTTETYEVYLSYTLSPGNDLLWSDPFRIPLGSEATVTVDDISTLVAFTDADGPKIGVAWSNQNEGDDRFHFAVHEDSSDPESGWTLDAAFGAVMTAPADDHLNFATTATGELFLVFKTGIDPSNPDDDDEMLIGLAAREADGTVSVIQVAPGSSRDTRPIVVVNESTDEVYVFTVNKTGGEAVCRFPATITSPLSDMVFLTDNCSPPEGESPDSPAALANLVDAELFIADSETYLLTNNPSSTKQRVTNMTGVLVIAGDESTNSYLHNLVGYTPPVPDETATPTGTSPAPTGTPTPTATGTVGPTPTGTTEVTLTPTTEPAPDDVMIYLPTFNNP